VEPEKQKSAKGKLKEAAALNKREHEKKKKKARIMP